MTLANCVVRRMKDHWHNIKRNPVKTSLTCFISTRDKFAGEKIPTLEEAVEECIKLQLTIYFDVKGHPDEVTPTKLPA